MIPQKYPATEYGCHREIDRLKEQLAKLQIEWGEEYIRAERIGLMYSPDEFMAMRRRAEMAESVIHAALEWSKKQIYSENIDLDELEEILGDKKSTEESKEV